jgi:hypothetical protein
MSNDKRVKSGIPAGGEFATHNRADANISLAVEDSFPGVHYLEPIDAALRGIAAARLAIDGAEAALHFEATEAIILNRFPAADHVVIDNAGDSIKGFPFTAHRILGSEGETLWELTPSSSNTDNSTRAFERELMQHVRQLPVDLKRVNKVFASPGGGRRREIQYVLPLR